MTFVLQIALNLLKVKFYEQVMIRKKNPKETNFRQIVALLILQHILLSVTYLNWYSDAYMSQNHCIVEAMVIFVYLYQFSELPISSDL